MAGFAKQLREELLEVGESCVTQGKRPKVCIPQDNELRARSTEATGIYRGREESQRVMPRLRYESGRVKGSHNVQ